jgi:trans-AT polyketide synthase, acyltransferase and oxidoreductase domains
MNQPVKGLKINSLENKKSYFEDSYIKSELLNLNNVLYVVRKQEDIGIIPSNQWSDYIEKNPDANLVALLPPISQANMGDKSFQDFYNTKYSFYVGAMANGISSEKMIIELCKNNLLGSFGSGGLTPTRIEEAIKKIQQSVPGKSVIFNLLYNPKEPLTEQKTVDLYLKYKIRIVEAAAFMTLSPSIVRYRVAGLHLNEQNKIVIENKIIAKISRSEMAEIFMNPAPVKILKDLLSQNLITKQQFNLGQKVPMADDITVEGDSGGHTDNRALVVTLPTIIMLRDRIQKEYGYSSRIRIGAAGGISTPASILSAFSMGASYIVTGSVNQSCIESGACEYSRKLLSTVKETDVMMAPAADMFEQGVKLQVLKKGTFFASRAQKLYDLYVKHNSIDEILASDKKNIEEKYFKKSFEEVWKDTVSYFNSIDPSIIISANQNPKKKMALIFRWYLGLASRWSNAGEPNREMDYQIWCGPSMGAFNSWVNGTYLENYKNREIVDITEQLFIGATYLCRIQYLKFQGVNLPPDFFQYYPINKLN